MKIKQDVTDYFKKDIEWDMCGQEELDPRIAYFIKVLNQNEHIKTIYSCEGHHQGDNGYIFFSVDEEGWEKFFMHVLPELGDRFLREQNGSAGMSQFRWHFSLKSNQYNAGIAIHGYFDPAPFYQDGKSWEEEKEFFWTTLEEVMLKNYPTTK